MKFAIIKQKIKKWYIEYEYEVTKIVLIIIITAILASVQYALEMV